ncbi:MAG: UPF0104 family protein [Microcystis sp. M015S2]|uniref:lysylphosphatidylglycerol synthase domain-containing protein n=1 Tax=unclassified Microcystis TaxID=2643300 RepID=UPI002586B816|nr:MULTISPECIES: lysylphosphatidylglycerol synthase domain-containing protein [unclassified Microcystis]MCA2656509.1 UPF0104 family protein [Microcystis sp. M061S2]MCA2711813.1 UPF0104 family protein [Microcystis sp. M025S2]MCA2742352.1 UPF0104 family protein [Microcystis sp. M015S2]MCA2760491.1 UPF0104 family protein [Microcystis sp. M145S2]
MCNKILRFAPIILSLSLFILAVWTISQEFKHYTFAQLLASLDHITTSRKLEAIFWMALGYLSMTGYDRLGFYYIKHPLALGTIIRTAFISYAFGNTIGLTLFSGTAIRYRFYTPAGVGVVDIAKVITFTHLSFWLGMLGIGGLSFLVDPQRIPQLLKLPFLTTKPLGIIFLLLVTGYFLLTLTYKKPIRIGQENIYLPSWTLSLALILLTFIDWILAARVLYLLLPGSYNVSFLGFFGLYIFAMTAGVLSNVPGGIGVFEFIMLRLRPEYVSNGELLGSLIAYRAIYYFLPLIVAFVWLLGYEARRK